MTSLKEYLIRTLENTKLFEMAKKRSQLGDDIDNISITLFQHWCLVRYCVLYDFGNINKDHWCNEVKSYITKIHAVVTTGYDKTTLVREVIIKRLEFNKYENIEFLFDDKFNTENIEVSEEQKKRIINDWIVLIPKLISVMGFTPQKDRNKTEYMLPKDYIEDYLLTVEER